MSAKQADAYLAKLTAEKRATLEKVRKAIRAAAPDAEEGMSYGMPAFFRGKAIAGYAVAANHCAYYPMSGAITAAMKVDLEGYETSKGAIRFPIGQPPPAALIRKLVRARLAEIDGAAAAKTAAKGAANKKPAAKAGGGDAAVAAYLRALEHPLKQEIEAVRRIILGVSPTIQEGIKWNAPSFRTNEDFFATFNMRAREGVQLVFHRGAKARDNEKALKIADPKGLMRWLASDRALVTLGKGRDVPANRGAFEAIVRAWLKAV
jgi:uncharacterized protein YdhG (YjbR/CyaY superfamily)